VSKETKPKNQLIRFFVFTYLIFWVLFGITGAAIMVLKAPKFIQYILPVICSWSPTFAFLVMFKKIYPDLKLQEFIKRQFNTRVKISLLIIIILIQTFIFLVVSFSYSIINNVAISSVIASSASVIILGFFDMLIRGPLGEEIGWRGYALNEMQKKFSPTAASIIIGVIWGFWHTPLWVVTSGYSGLDLVKYMALFLISIIAVSIIITAFYNLNKNLLIPIMIHQLLNFLASLIITDTLQAFYYMAPLYVITAIVILVINPKKVLYGAGRVHIGEMNREM
jgi:membrane protease YdiL (CAAX protease family)